MQTFCCWINEIVIISLWCFLVMAALFIVSTCRLHRRGNHGLGCSCRGQEKKKSNSKNKKKTKSKTRNRGKNMTKRPRRDEGWQEKDPPGGGEGRWWKSGKAAPPPFGSSLEDDAMKTDVRQKSDTESLKLEVIVGNCSSVITHIIQRLRNPHLLAVIYICAQEEANVTDCESLQEGQERKCHVTGFHICEENHRKDY